MQATESEARASGEEGWFAKEEEADVMDRRLGTLWCGEWHVRSRRTLGDWLAGEVVHGEGT